MFETIGLETNLLPGNFVPQPSVKVVRCCEFYGQINQKNHSSQDAPGYYIVWVQSSIITTKTGSSVATCL